MTEQGKKVWKELEKMGYSNKPEDLHLEYFEDIIKATKQALTIPNVISWVAVEEKMPKSGQCVLLYSPKSGVGEGAWIDEKGHFEQWRWNAILTNVSHWMLMPKSPCL